MTKSTTQRGLTVAAALIVVGGLLAGGTLVRGQVQSQEQVTFTKDIAPILQRSCQNCHRPNGGIAPMALTTYEEVRPWAKAMKARTSLREMPPWFIEKNVGIQKFKDDPSLSDAEIAKIAAWVDSGAPQGNPADMPAPKQFAAAGAWTFGIPDLVVESPETKLDAVAGDWHGDIGSTPTGLTEDRYVKAVEIRERRVGEKKISGRTDADYNYFAIHHCSVSSSPGRGGGEGEEDTAADPTAARARRQVTGGFGYLSEVGQNAMIYPDDSAPVLRAGSRLYFGNVHLHSIGQEVRLHAQVGFKLHPKGYQPKYTMGGVGVMAVKADSIDIPAGQDNVKLEAYTALVRPVKLFTHEPHMHATGKRMCVEAIYPDGRRETLNCSGYNHNWVKTYVYDDDVAPLLPAGTIVHVTGWYDNSAKNPRNPEPRNWKGHGHRSIDDMFMILPRGAALTEDQYKEEVAARQAKRRAAARTTVAQN